MEWCKEILEQVKFENISNEDEKKKIATKNRSREARDINNSPQTWD